MTEPRNPDSSPGKNSLPPASKSGPAGAGNPPGRTPGIQKKVARAVQKSQAIQRELGKTGDPAARLLEPFETLLSSLEGIEERLRLPQEKAEDVSALRSQLQELIRGKALRKYIRKFKMMGTAEEVDEFGYDPVFWELVEPIFEFLYEKYWRITAIGVDHIPYSGRALLVANHSGMLPYDGAMISQAIRKEHPSQRNARFLAENFVSRMPVVAPFIVRLGMPRACPENAERLLLQEELVGVFPEGVKGIGKEFRYRYQVQRFGRGGTIRLLLRTRSPAIPVAVVGAEEIHPIIARADYLTRFIGLPIFPIPLTSLFLGPLAFIPLPSKWYIKFGQPVFYDQYDEKDLEDDVLVNQLNEELRGRVQEMIIELLKKRRSIWFG